MMKEENVYEETTQTEEVAAAKNQEEASTVLGKFKDVDALVRAYSSLQAEFTRRSQKLKELEKEAEEWKRKNGADEMGVEKLRKSAEARWAATKAFDEFVAEVGKAHAEEVAKGTEPEGGKDLPSETAEANTVEEAGTAKPKESLGSLLTLTCLEDQIDHIEGVTLAISNEMGVLLCKMLEDLDTYDEPPLLTRVEKMVNGYLFTYGDRECEDDGPCVVYVVSETPVLPAERVIKEEAK